VNFGLKTYSDGAFIKSPFSGQSMYPDTYNPFKVNEKYLTTFKVIFTNEMEKIVKISADNLQIISGYEQLAPMRTEYFEKNLSGNSEKLKNIYRMNLPDNLTIAPHQSIIKYFAVPTINLDVKQLMVNFISEEKVFTFNFNVTNYLIKNKYIYKGVQLFHKSSLFGDGNLELVVFMQRNRVFSLLGKTLYVLSNQKSEPVNLYYMWWNGDEYKYGRILSSTGNLKSKTKAPLWYFKEISRNPNAVYDSTEED
jgi:hypothetical protein